MDAETIIALGSLITVSLGAISAWNTSKINNMQVAMEALQKTISVLQDENKRLTERFSASEADNAELRARIESLETERLQMQARIDSLECENAELKRSQERKGRR